MQQEIIQKGVHGREGGRQLATHKLIHPVSFVDARMPKKYGRQYKSLNTSLYSSIEGHERAGANGEKRLSETIEVSRDHEIYFNRNKKYNYMKKIIDKYFQETKRDKWHHKVKNNPEQLSLINQHFVSATSSIAATLQKEQNKQKKRNLQKEQNAQKEKEEQKEHVKRAQLQQNKGKVRHLSEISRKSKGSLAREQQQDLDGNLVQSRLLVQDNLQIMPSIDGNRSLSFSSKHNSIILPRIDESMEDRDDQFESIRYQSISSFNENHLDSVRESRAKLLENEIYVVEMVLKNGRPSHKLKVYKEKGEAILSRQQRARSMGVESVWIQYKYDPRALISNASPCLKDLLFSARRVDADSKFYTLKTKKYYKTLTANNCQQLKRVVRQFCQFMKRFQGKVLNNKINTANLYIAKHENLRLGEWGFASFRQTHLIQSMSFQNRLEPIVKSQKEWFVPPEYLAPEILRALVHDQDVDLMGLGAAPDIWSLGVALFEILTVIPVWIPQKCVVHGKTMVARSGVLAVAERDLKRLLKREEKLAYLVRRVLDEEFGEERFCKEVVEVIERCVDYNPEQRLGYDQIIQILS